MYVFVFVCMCVYVCVKLWSSLSLFSRPVAGRPEAVYYLPFQRQKIRIPGVALHDPESGAFCAQEVHRSPIHPQLFVMVWTAPDENGYTQDDLHTQSLFVIMPRGSLYRSKTT